MSLRRRWCTAAAVAAEGRVVKARQLAVGAAGEVVVLAECAERAVAGAGRIGHGVVATVPGRAAVRAALAARVAEPGRRERECRGRGRQYREPLHVLPFLWSCRLGYAPRVDKAKRPPRGPLCEGGIRGRWYARGIDYLSVPPLPLKGEPPGSDPKRGLTPAVRTTASCLRRCSGRSHLRAGMCRR